MPEPGVNDRDFNNPTTGRQKPRRRKSRTRLKLPGERSAVKEALRQSYNNGREVAETEVRRRGLGQVLSRPGGALAQRKLKQFEDQWEDRTKPINPSRVYGSTFGGLPRIVKNRMKLATNSAIGAAGERHGFDLAKKMDPQARREVTVETPPQFAQNRRYDFLGRRWSDQAKEEAHAIYAWLRGREGNHYRALPVYSEAKTGGADLSGPQKRIDTEARANPGSFGDPLVTSISNVRIFDYQIPIEKAFRVLDSRFDTLVRKGRIDEATKEALLSALISMREGGKKTITLADYADLYTKFVPAAVAKGTGEDRYGASGEED